MQTDTACGQHYPDLAAELHRRYSEMPPLVYQKFRSTLSDTTQKPGILLCTMGYDVQGGATIVRWSVLERSLDGVAPESNGMMFRIPALLHNANIPHATVKGVLYDVVHRACIDGLAAHAVKASPDDLAVEQILNLNEFLKVWFCSVAFLMISATRHVDGSVKGGVASRALHTPDRPGEGYFDV